MKTKQTQESDIAGVATILGPTNDNPKVNVKHFFRDSVKTACNRREIMLYYRLKSNPKRGRGAIG